MRVLRIVAIPVILLALVSVGGCIGQTPPAAPPLPITSATATSTAPSAASAQGGGVVVGLDVQRTPGGKLGGDAWVMSGDGSADLVAAQPALTLAALNAAGKPTVIFTSQGPKSGLITSVMDTFVVKIPAGTVSLQLTTAAKLKGGAAATPELMVQLSDVNVSPTLDVPTGSAGAF